MVRDQDPAPASRISLRGQASLPEREECENISAAEVVDRFPASLEKWVGETDYRGRCQT